MHGHKNLPWQREQYGQCHFLLNTRPRPGPGGSVREAKFVRRSNCQGNCTCGVRTQQLPAAPQRHAATSCEDVDDAQGWLAHSVAAAVDASPACPSQGNTETRRGKLTVSYTATSQPSRQTRCENLYGNDVSSYEIIKSVSCSLRSSVHNLKNWGRFGISTNSMT